jgi:hypothetical protein
MRLYVSTRYHKQSNILANLHMRSTNVNLPSAGNAIVSYPAFVAHSTVVLRNCRMEFSSRSPSFESGTHGLKRIFLHDNLPAVVNTQRCLSTSLAVKPDASRTLFMSPLDVEHTTMTSTYINNFVFHPLIKCNNQKTCFITCLFSD